MKTSILLAQAEEAHHTVVEIPMDPIWYGVISLAIFFFLMFVTMSWKGISHRH